MPQTIDRLHIAVAGSAYPLAPLESVEDLKSAIVQAVRAGGGFVEVALDDGRRLSVLVVPTTSVLIFSQTVPLDTGDADSYRYGTTGTPAGPFDYQDDSPFDLI